MIQKNLMGTYDAECDSCSYHEEIEEADFLRVVEIMKKDGWDLTRVASGSWKHLCPDCKTKKDFSDFTGVE